MGLDQKLVLLEAAEEQQRRHMPPSQGKGTFAWQGMYRGFGSLLSELIH